MRQGWRLAMVRAINFCSAGVYSLYSFLGSLTAYKFPIAQSAYLNSGSAFKESLVAPGSTIFLSRTWREV